MYGKIFKGIWPIVFYLLILIRFYTPAVWQNLPTRITNYKLQIKA